MPRAPSGWTLYIAVKLLVGAYARWIGCKPASTQRIHLANHSNHLDTLAIWSALPNELRRRTRPIAARDYWGRGFKRYVATQALGAVLIDRTREDRDSDPLEPLRAALQSGNSLIIFPEGTRGTSAVPARFRSGLFRLSEEFPSLELVPVYLDNLHRALPQGASVPVPFVCTMRIGTPLTCIAAETRDAFLARARLAVMATGGIEESARA